MLRIIAGEFKHRRLETPEGTGKTRPLPDRVRVSLFSMLQGHIEDQMVADYFAGSGSFGLEALSRGARHCVFVEKDREVAQALKRNIELLGVADRSEVFVGDALGLGALSRCPDPVHLVFFDPPYPMVEDPGTRKRVFEQFVSLTHRLDETGYSMMRTPWPFRTSVDRDADKEEGTAVSLTMPEIRGPETHTYGSTAIHWYMRNPS